MKISKKSKASLRQLFYGFLILFPSILTGNVYSSITKESSTINMLSGLRALTDTIYANIDASQHHLTYACKLMLSHDAFTSLNISAISMLLGEFSFYQPSIKNLYVIDSNFNVLYGINDTLLSGVNYTAHIESALKGTPSYYGTYINNEAFIQSSYPIQSADSISSTVGALVLTYDFLPLQKLLVTLNSNSPNLNGYLIDSNGTIITSSSNKALNYKDYEININRIKQTLDYDPTATFELFGEEMNGIYYNFPNAQWTLLVTSSPHEVIQLADIIAWLSGFIGIGGISTSEMIRKKLSASTLLGEVFEMHSSDK